jgi:hypothetical protein
MFIGTSDIDQCKYLLEDYVEDADEYRFAARTLQESSKTGTMSCSVWLARGPGDHWFGWLPISTIIDGQVVAPDSDAVQQRRRG